MLQPFMGYKEMYDPLTRLRGTCNQLNNEILTWGVANKCRIYDPIIGFVDVRHEIRIRWDYGTPRGGSGLLYTLPFFTWEPDEQVSFTVEFHAWLKEMLEIASMYWQ